MINVNDFHGKTDSEVIELAMQNLTGDGILVIPPRESDIEPERKHWLIDRAILIPENTTVILQNCMIKLSDRCRDNFFRSANCGIGIDDPQRIKNIHIRGEGFCTLQGADYPRATGDSSKLLARPCPYYKEDMVKYGYWIPEEKRAAGELGFWDMHDHSYGTDIGKEGQHQKGDWRNIGILFANVEHFSIENIRLEDYHAWGITIENCAYGSIRKIDFNACMSKEIDGLRQNMENQDGVHVRKGSHHILITDITGRTGDDVIAITSWDTPGCEFTPGCEIGSFQALPCHWDKQNYDVHDIIIRNVIAYSQLCWVIRLLASNNKLWNIVIDGVIDAAVEEAPHRQYSGTILVGREDEPGAVHTKDSMRNITISNVVCNARKGIEVHGYLKDSVITNVCNRHPEGSVIAVFRENGLDNVATGCLCASGENPVFEYKNIPESPAV